MMIDISNLYMCKGAIGRVKIPVKITDRLDNA